jgi:hypothetical protein
MNENYGLEFQDEERECVCVQNVKKEARKLWIKIVFFSSLLCSFSLKLHFSLGYWCVFSWDK